MPCMLGTEMRYANKRMHVAGCGYLQVREYQVYYATNRQPRSLALINGRRVLGRTFGHQGPHFRTPDEGQLEGAWGPEKERRRK